MNYPPLRNLDLRAPLVYQRIQNPVLRGFPFNFQVKPAKNEEILLCFNLDPANSRSIEPEKARFIDILSFTGQKNTSDEGKPGVSDSKIDCSGDEKGQTVSLPAGNYLFMQSRSDIQEPCTAQNTANPVNTTDEWLDLAIEQQKDGLWERNVLQDILFVRFFYEDNALVTQVFRPVVKK
ncbi:MAG: hypothetical protein LBH16_01385 [Treponema sp.]|nr:hypothetical protein [Treponema sp.]